MSKLKQYRSIILLVVIILGGLFYWYEWRPVEVRKACSQKSQDEAIKSLKTRSEFSDKYEKAAEKGLMSKDDADFYYRRCLNKYGLEN